MKTAAEPVPPESSAPVKRSRFEPKPKDSWKKLIGRAKEDDLSPDAYRLGEEWRERMNREGR